MDQIKKPLDFRKTHFVLSAPDIHALKEDNNLEIAFVGRSNAGKSSALNTICDQKGLAKTSTTPGRTRLINLFEVATGKYLVDLPGYGYAAVPESMKRQWQKAMTQYLQQRRSLCGLVVAMDIRTPLKDHDRLILDWSTQAQLKTLILLTKCDKIGTTQRQQTIEQVKLALSEFGGNFTVIAFSSLKKIGLEATREVLKHWFEEGSDE